MDGCQNDYQLCRGRKLRVSEKKERFSRCCYEDDLVAKYLGWDTKEQERRKYVRGTVSLGVIRTSLVEPAAETRAEHSRSDGWGSWQKNIAVFKIKKKKKKTAVTVLLTVDLTAHF